MMSRHSAKRARFSETGTRKPWNWLGMEPRPTPNSRRPPERMSAVAACSAQASGWCSGSSVTAVPTRMRLVRWAIAGTAMSGVESREKAAPKWISARHATSKPSASASVASSSISVKRWACVSPARSGAWKKRPNRIEGRAAGARERPAEPLADAAPHHVVQILALEPRQVLGEERDALVVGARHAGEVGPPERPLRPEGVHQPPDAVVQIRERVGLGRERHHARGLHRHVRVLGQRADRGELLEDLGRLAAYADAHVVDHELEARMFPGDPVEVIERAGDQHHQRHARLLGGGPQPVGS